MDKSRANILQIRKYLNGELDAKAMHQLEREAQSDPFLMDALEGYQMAGGNNQQRSLDILAERLDARVTPTVRRMIPWTAISIAAGVVGFLIVVGLLYKTKEPAGLPQTAEVKVQPRLKADTLNAPSVSPGRTDDVAELELKPAIAAKPAKVFYPKPHTYGAVVARVQDKKLAEPPAASPLAEVTVAPAVDKAATPLDEMVMGAIIKQRDSMAMPATVAIAKHPISQPLNGKVDGVITSPQKGVTNQYELQKLNLPPGFVQDLSANTTVPRPNLYGKGIAEAKPLSNNNSGYLAAPATGEATYKSNEAQNGIYSNSIGLNTNAGSVGDSGRVFSDRANFNTLALAHPQKGWVMYQLYLSQKCTLPAGQTPGVVEVKFKVGPMGDISDITVVKGLSPIADKKAVQIITEGPKWVGNTNGKPEEKTLQLEFINK